MEQNENQNKSHGTLVTVIIIVVVLGILTALLIPLISGSIKKSPDKENYPYVLVHGLMGFGASSSINDVVSYWGASAGRLSAMVEDDGYTLYEASVGPVSSTWDRACELYAQLFGGRVDYGEAHSAQHGHDRYGRLYEPLFEGFGESVEKVNLVSHSFGGATVRLLSSLMEYGDESEKNASDTVSPLFEGGHGEMINSVTTLCSPHNGTTLMHVIDGVYPFSDLLVDMAFLFSGTAGNATNELFDFQLEHFGITTKKGEKLTENELRNTIDLIMSDTEDNAAVELSPEGAEKLNKKIRLSPDTLYISYPFSATHEGSLSSNHVADSDTFVLLRLPARLIGAYSKNLVSDIAVDASWRENDGLVNTVSAKYPFGDNHRDHTTDSALQRGIWNVMPVQHGDHAKAVGMGQSSAEFEEFFLELFSMIEAEN